MLSDQMEKTIFYKRLTFFISTTILTGCSYFVSSTTHRFGENISQAILNSNDPETVAKAMPSYLILLESLILESPKDEQLLSSAASLYNAYINFLPNNPNQNALLSEKSFQYSLAAACASNTIFCNIESIEFNQFDQRIQNSTIEDLDKLFLLGSSWANWIKWHRQDWNAIAQLAQVKLIMKRVIYLDERYKMGAAHAYLGVLSSLVPPALGGNLKAAKKHFSYAIKLSEQKNLMFKVLFAKQYARMKFDRELHDQLLNEVISASPKHPNLTLSNSLAQKQAQELLNTADDYF